MLVYILIGLAVVVAGFLALVAAQPAGFRISRSTLVAAPPEVVFAEINDLRCWNDWSPWAKLDPQMEQHYEGPPTGVGAVSRWKGNAQVGEGRMEITESSSPEFVTIQLDFIKPFQATNFAQFVLESPGHRQTSVTWAMSGRRNFMMKLFHLLMNVDKMLGKQFDQGLSQLKEVAERAART
ncbi:MAG: SRPBCC family protein [Planctomycetaceae bacterium]|nr:SRPBCC family protein [Planctomycetaceae bacterium]